MAAAPLLAPLRLMRTRAGEARRSQPSPRGWASPLPAPPPPERHERAGSCAASLCVQCVQGRIKRSENRSQRSPLLMPHLGRGASVPASPRLPPVPQAHASSTHGVSALKNHTHSHGRLQVDSRFACGAGRRTRNLPPLAPQPGRRRRRNACKHERCPPQHRRADAACCHGSAWESGVARVAQHGRQRFSGARGSRECALRERHGVPLLGAPAPDVCGDPQGLQRLVPYVPPHAQFPVFVPGVLLWGVAWGWCSRVEAVSAGWVVPAQDTEHAESP